MKICYLSQNNGQWKASSALIKVSLYNDYKLILALGILQDKDNARIRICQFTWGMKSVFWRDGSGFGGSMIAFSGSMITFLCSMITQTIL